MENYELIIETIDCYKNKACEVASNRCDRCEAAEEHNGQPVCAFDTVNRFIEWDKKYNKRKETVKQGYWEQGDIYDIGDVCSLCGYDSFLEPCDLSHCPSCHAEMKTK